MPERPSDARPRPRKPSFRRFLIAVGVVALGIQLVPYGRAHENPAVVREPRWDSPRTRELAARACMDCHGNETVWPWYSHVAPSSWLVQSHVDDGRRHLNFSDWDNAAEEQHEIEEMVESGEMPMRGYVALHPEAKLTDEEKTALLVGMKATLAQDPGGKRRRRGPEEHEEHQAREH